MENETIIVISFLSKRSSPIHYTCELDTVEEFKEACYELILHHINFIQRELLLQALNKVNWEIVSKFDQYETMKKEEMVDGNEYHEYHEEDEEDEEE